MPGAFLEEPHRCVEGRAAPHFEREHLGDEPGVGGGDPQHVIGPQPCRQQRLVGVTHRGVGDQQAALPIDPIDEPFDPFFLPQVAGAGGDRPMGVEFRERCGGQSRRLGAAFDEFVAVDDRFGEELEHLRGAVAADRQFEELGGLVDHPRRRFAGEEGRVIHQPRQEGDVRLDAADAEFAEAAVHAGGGFFERPAACGHFDQERIVERVDDRAAEGAAGVEADPEAGRGAVVRDPAVIGAELVSGVFGGDAALDRETARPDLAL